MALFNEITLNFVSQFPGAGRLGQPDLHDLRRLNQDADFDTRYIMLSNLL